MGIKLFEATCQCMFKAINKAIYHFELIQPLSKCNCSSYVLHVYTVAQKPIMYIPNKRRAQLFGNYDL